MGMTRAEFEKGMTGVEISHRIGLDSLRVKERNARERIAAAKKGRRR